MEERCLARPGQTDERDLHGGIEFGRTSGARVSPLPDSGGGVYHRGPANTMREVTLTGDQFILVIALVKLGVMASLTSLLVRSRRFTDAIFTTHRTIGTQAVIALWLGLPFMIGAVLRVVLGYEALDMGLEGPYVAGLLGGVHPGLMVGALTGWPGLAKGEWLSLPMGFFTGALAGFI